MDRPILAAIVLIVFLCLGLIILGVVEQAAQIADHPEPPDFETIQVTGPWLEIVDEGRRRSKYRNKSIVGAVHWKPGQHPEGRPWDAVELQMNSIRIRLDCKEGTDADKIYDLAGSE